MTLPVIHRNVADHRITTKVVRQLQLLKAPLIWPSAATPAIEHAAVKNLYAHLIGLQYSVEKWKAALLLYNTAKEPPPTITRSVARRWRFIACHECVLELYQLRSRLGKIQSVQLRSCPSLRTYVDMSVLRGARRHLDEYFPDIEALRHATAHSGENESHPEIHAPDGQYALTGFGESDRFSSPYEGQLRYLDITEESLQKIAQVVGEFFEGFEVAAMELERHGHVD